MRSRTLVAALALVAIAAAVTPASAQDSYRHGRILYVEPGVTLQRATEVTAEEAFRNLPFLPGDRVWTDAAGRAEFQFPEATVVRLDRRSKLDYAGHEEEGEERIVLRLWSGSVVVHARTGGSNRFEIETPAGLVRTFDRGVARVDVESGETRLSVYAGEAALDDGRQQLRLAAGERTFAGWGAQAEEPRRFDLAEVDEFLSWDGRRESEEAQGPRAAEYLPEELDSYAGELEENGSWQHGGVEGYVWIPRVEVGWQPYWNGHWAWTPYGWTWVPYESWGWAPFHYGRWGFSASLGWYWSPGRTWGPAWVSWAVGDGYVGWCPLGRHDRPVVAWGDHGGYRSARFGRHDPWSVVRRGDLGGHDLGRRRVLSDRIDPAALRVADTSVMRPTRDATALREGDAHPRAISRRQTIGDYVRELGVDNKTTIPAPWTRGYGPPPAGVDGARYGAHGRDRGEDAEGTRPATSSTPRPGGSSAGQRDREASPAATGGATPRESRLSGSTLGSRPREPQGGRVEARERTGQRGDDRSGSGATYRPRSDGEGGGSRPHGGSEGSSAYRPRSSPPEGGRGYRPRSDAGASHTHSEGGGHRAPGNGGGSQARPSGGSSSGSSHGGGGHATSRGGRN